MNWKQLAHALKLPLSASASDADARLAVMQRLGLDAGASLADITSAARAGGVRQPLALNDGGGARRMPVAHGDWWQAYALAPRGDLDEGARAEVLIYGDIGDSIFGDTVAARDLVATLSELDADELDVRINSFGGSVADGLAIFSALRRYEGTVTTHIDGVAYSIASLIAMGGQQVRMSASGRFMVHAPWVIALGNSRELRMTADVLDGYAESMTEAYIKHTGADSRDTVMGLLTDGEDHYYSAEEARAAGFVDEIDDELDIAAHATSRPFRAVRGVPEGALKPAAAARQRPTPEPTNEDTIMWKSLARAHGIKLSADADEAAARAQLVTHFNLSADAEDDDIVAAATKPAQPAPASGGGDDPHAAFRAAESTRRNNIRAVFRPFREHDGVAEVEEACLDNLECTAEQARAKLLDKLGDGQEPIAGGGGRMEITRDQRDTMRTGMAAAMLHRAQPSAHQLDDAARNYRGMRALDIARECLAAAGVNTRGRTPGEIAVMALHSTDDFPFILENIANKTLRGAYEGTPRSFVPYSRQVTLPDFKEVSRVQLGGAPNLKLVLEGAEYEVGTIGEGREKYRAQKYGRLVPFTWEMVINDDLDAFMRLLQMFGRSAGDLESDLVYGIFTGNPNMADGTPLFHADHGNLGTGGVISDTTLSEIEELMMLQKGIEGRYITVRPEYLIVPPRLKTTAEKQLAIVEPNKAADVSPFSNSLQLIVEPRLQDDSAAAWYMAASPNAVDTIEYGYLEGNEGVFTESWQGRERDGFVVKCRHVFATKAIDHKGLAKNAGE